MPFAFNKLRVSHFAVCLFPLLFAACGKMGDPIPPTPRAPLIVTELTVAQQGSRLLLSFPLTRTNRSTPPQRIDIYRLIEADSAPRAVTQEAFETRATVIGSIAGTEIKIGTTTINYEDGLDLLQANVQANGATSVNASAGALGKQRYRYAVRVFNQDGRAADFSNYAVITPLTELAAPPSQPQAKLTQTELALTWEAPAANENGTQPANIAGYNLYRKTGTTLAKLNAQPLREPQFTDKVFQFGTAYEYFVRPLSLPLGATVIAERGTTRLSATAPKPLDLSNAIEGNASPVLAYTPRDTFAPVAPEAVTLASISGIVTLFWPSNAEPDLAGYHIYRAEQADASAGQWARVNQRLHTPTTFRDERVQVGKTYFYRLTAVDVAGNESAPSTVVSETVNP